MNFIAILAALGLEQWRAFEWRAGVERAFVRYVRTIERKFNGGTQQHGVLAAIAAIAPAGRGRRRRVLARRRRASGRSASSSTSSSCIS